MMSGMHTTMQVLYKLMSIVLSCYSEILAKWTSLLHNIFTDFPNALPSPYQYEYPV